MTQLLSQEFFMEQALKEARKAFEEDEVPIGAVVVSGNKIIGRGYNQTEKLHDITAHAEMLAITAASNYLGSKYLDDCVLFVSIEPCVMCAGAIKAARLAKVVYGASEPKTGFSNFVVSEFQDNFPEIESGICKEEASELMKSFFAQKRK